MTAPWRPSAFFARLARRSTSGRVAQGPFRGMRYTKLSWGSVYVPKLLGIYERELASCIESAVAAAPAHIVNIGAAEGYYAVGMSMRCPGAVVTAFEQEAAASSMILELARMNGVEGRVHIRGLCDGDALAAVLSEEVPTLVISDCEGAEVALLDPEKIPRLRGARLLVEVHDFLIPDGGTTLETRFRASHRIERIEPTPRDASDFPYRSLATSFLPGRYREWIVSEWRPPQNYWFWMEPR
jgi:hypothetical protein